MEAAMASSFTESTAKFILEKLGSLLAQEATLLCGVGANVQYIMDELESMASLLSVLSERQDHDQQVKTWMKQVREMAYDAEDSIDIFKHRLGRAPRQHNRYLDCLIHTTHLVRTLKARYCVATDLQMLKFRARDVSERRGRYYLASGTTTSGGVSSRSSAANQSDPLLSAPVVREVEAKSLDQACSELIAWLMEENQPHRGVISLGGTARTALAMQIYRRTAVTDGHFQAHAWIKVSESYKIEELLRTMIRQLSVREQEIQQVLGNPPDEVEVEQPLDKMGEAELVKMSRDYLRDKRYVVFLDDIWTTDAWDRIKVALPDKKNGSRIIVTTRDGTVANAYFSHNHHHVIYQIPSFSPDHSFPEEIRPVGIDERRQKVIGWLMEEKQSQLRVISLVGFGGLGKTTLAKMAYESPAVTGGHFQARAWIAVSQTFEAKVLLRNMISQFSFSDKEIKKVLESPDSTLEREELKKRLERKLDKMGEADLVSTVNYYLKGKRFLIVLDDVWSTSAWDRFKVALPDNNKGSSIIVTTRKMEVANTACSSHDHQFIYEIPPLSFKQSWQLFCERVFEYPKHTCPENLTKLTDDILRKCDGLPLAIVTIAGLLATKPEKTPEEWRKLHDHLGSELETNARLEKIKRILLLSYNDLPHYLKPCFLYVSIFPEDYEINRKLLVRRWMAEGFVNRRRDMSDEEVGEGYFDELISRSLILPSDIGGDGKVKSCRVHDIILEVIVSMSMEENFVTVIGERSIAIPHDKIRRLAIQGRSTVKDDLYLSQVRSLTVFSSEVALQDYGKARLVRVLDLEGCECRLKQNDLKNICKLFLLKFLSLRGTDVEKEKLPDSIGNLRNLRFLDIRHTYIRRLPNAVAKLRGLAYLLGDYLRLPKGIGKMKGLENLGEIDASGSHSSVLREIGEMTRLKKLNIYFDRRKYKRGIRLVNHKPSVGQIWRDYSREKERLCTSLEKLKSCLRSLRLEDYTFGGKVINVLNDLSHSTAPLHLQSICLEGQLEALPTWFASLNQIAKISLQGTKLDHDAIQVLKNLPTLVRLVLGWGSFVRRNEPPEEQSEGSSEVVDQNLHFGCDGFTGLKLLEIDSDELGLSVEDGALPNLELLKLYGDFGGQSISGVEHLPKLKELHLFTSNKSLQDMIKTTTEAHPNIPILWCKEFNGASPENNPREWACLEES